MKGGIEAANCVTTVSPTYAKEILDPWYAHSWRLFYGSGPGKLPGILNGIDTVSYDPAADPDLYAPYSVQAGAERP